MKPELSSAEWSKDGGSSREVNNWRHRPNGVGRFSPVLLRPAPTGAPADFGAFNRSCSLTLNKSELQCMRCSGSGRLSSAGLALLFHLVPAIFEGDQRSRQLHIQHAAFSEELSVLMSAVRIALAALLLLLGATRAVAELMSADDHQAYQAAFAAARAGLVGDKAKCRSGHGASPGKGPALAGVDARQHGEIRRHRRCYRS
jgi:hypothetical protein